MSSTYHYSPEGSKYHEEGNPPREPTREPTREPPQPPLRFGEVAGLADVTRERIKNAEIERLNRLIEVMQEQSQHYLGEANAETAHWQRIAYQQMEKAAVWEQEYDKLFALLNPKCESCESKGFIFTTELTESKHPYKIAVPCPQGCGALPASKYLSGEEQLDRTNAFIKSQLDKYPQA